MLPLLNAGGTMSPKRTFRVFTAALALLLTVFSSVQSAHQIALNVARIQDDRNNQTQQHEPDIYNSHQNKSQQNSSRHGDNTENILLYKNATKAEDSAAELTDINFSFVSMTENVTSSTFATNNSLVSPADTVINSTSGISVIHDMFTSTAENVTHSTSHMSDIFDYYETDGEENYENTSDVQDANVTSSSLTESVSNTTINMPDSIHFLTTQSQTDHERQTEETAKTKENKTLDKIITSSGSQLNQLNHTNFSRGNKTYNFNSQNESPSTMGDNASEEEEEDQEDDSWSTDSLSQHSSSENNSSDRDTLKKSGCITCKIRAIDKHYRILQLKNHILNSLHMSSPPNTTGISIPKVPALTHLYEMDADLVGDSPDGKRNDHADDYEDDFLIKTERVFLSAKEAPMALHLNMTDTVYFPPAVQLFTSEIRSAYLWFYIRKNDVPPSYITVDRIIPEAKPGRVFGGKKLFSLKLAKDKAFGWKRIDMKDTLQQWVRHPMTNFGLQIRAEDNFGKNLIVLPPASEVDKGYEPWLDTKIVEQRHRSRRRRSEALMCAENSNDTRCCRHPLLVGFAEFGWEWIIAPTHVNADYCTGECRLTFQDNTPYNWITNQNVPGTSSCCTPTKLSPLPLLYFDESMNIVYQILQNMKVDKCGCS